MGWIGGFFPHSPAKRGPFSGAGWKAVGDGGKALMAQFSDGFDDGASGFGSALAVPSVLAPRVALPSPGSLDDFTSGAGAGGGIHIGAIYNPVPEPATTSVRREVAKGVYLGIDGLEDVYA